MSLKTYLVGIAISTFLCWSAFFLTVTNIDPFLADYSGLASFFVSFFLGLLGLVILITIYIRSRIYSVAELYEKMPVLVRQSFFISIGLTAGLWMQSMRVFRWWTGLMLLIILILVEISFYANKYSFDNVVTPTDEPEKPQSLETN